MRGYCAPWAPCAPVPASWRLALGGLKVRGLEATVTAITLVNEAL